VGSLESNHAQVFAGGAERLPKANPTAFSSSELIKNVSNPPLVYVPLAGALRYCLTPRLPRWKGIEMFVGTPFEEVKGRLAFQICLENGLAIREGETPFEARNQASWVTLEFPELYNAGGQSFILTLRLQEPRRTKIGIFETQHTRSLVRHAARRLGVSQVGHNLFCRLVY